MSKHAASAGVTLLGILLSFGLSSTTSVANAGDRVITSGARPIASWIADRPSDNRSETQSALGLACSPTLLAVPVTGAAMLAFTVETAPTDDLTVFLSSNNPDVASVPSTVTIAASQTSTTAAISGLMQGATFITASVSAEQARCSVYVGPSFSGDVVGLPSQSLRVVVGGPESTIVQPARVVVGWPESTITQPVKVLVQEPKP